MNMKRFLGTALCIGTTLAASADTNWMVLPRYSKTGRTLLHGCRNNPKPTPLKLRWEKPGENGKYRYLSVGNKSGFRFGGINERGVATIYTGGGPMVDKIPAKSPENFSGRRAVTEILRNCATAAEGEALLKAAAAKKLIAESLIVFITDRNYAWVVECSPDNYVSWELPHAFCVYANLWKLPGMDASSISPVQRTLQCCQREWAVRETLRRKLDANKTISIQDSFAAARLNTDDLNGEEYKLTAPHNRTSYDSYLFESDPEFGDLSCIYVAYGPARHTVFLPVPLGAADALPQELFTEEWMGGAFARPKAAKPGDPVNPEIVKFEEKLYAEFHKTRERARQNLRQDRPKRARTLLRECLKKQAAETYAFLKNDCRPLPEAETAKKDDCPKPAAAPTDAAPAPAK